ncbi:hypothetical protein RI367_000641 [Sorochytrium milnesiophthora]
MAPQEVTDKDSRSPRHRWVVLVYACLIVFGVAYCYSIPTVGYILFFWALGNSLHDWLGSSEDDFQWQLNLMYSIYAIPSTFLPLVSGYLMDRFGHAPMLISATLISLLGSALIAFGVGVRNFTVIAVGRLLYGIGAEPLEVVSAKIIADWFHTGGELALAYGLSFSCTSGAAMIQDNISLRLPKLFHSAAPAPIVAFWFGFAVSLFSALCGVVLLYIDRPTVRAQYSITQGASKSTAKASTESISEDSSSTLTVVDNAPAMQLSRQVSASTTSDLNTLRPLEPPQSSNGEPVTLLHIRTLPGTFWLLCLVAVAFQGCINAFDNILTEFLQFRWNIDDETAGSLMSVLVAVCLALSPAYGVIVDRYGYRDKYYMPVSAVLVGVAHVLLNFTLLSPIPSLVLLGLARTVVVALTWVCAPDIVQTRLLGTAFGFLSVLTNLARIVFPLLVAHIRASSQDYSGVGIFFIAISAATVGLSVALEFGFRATLQPQTTERHAASSTASAADSDTMVPSVQEDTLPARQRHAKPLKLDMGAVARQAGEQAPSGISSALPARLAATGISRQSPRLHSAASSPLSANSAT